MLPDWGSQALKIGCDSSLPALDPCKDRHNKGHKRFGTNRSRKRLRRGGKNTQKNCTKDLHDQDNHDAVITHLEPDILVCEVKWASGSINMNKVSGGDRIPAKLFQILKDDAVKGAALYMPGNLENSVVDTGLEKAIFSFQYHRRAMPKRKQRFRESTRERERRSKK